PLPLEAVAVLGATLRVRLRPASWNVLVLSHVPP
ncbi:MAG: hypothetical protein JWP22_4276, partial [Ramlibacter sp.]|nr:hypothetical protein [Ramlibacter sp.]